jgi:pimeloyl-ACP methyl ester carboxylesterase
MAATPSEMYARLDVPVVLQRLFHPRPESAAPTAAEELLIPVAPGAAIGARFYAAGPAQPTLLFFHGNGEIVEDYEDLAPLYTQRGLNFLPADYRGYGRSTGVPTVSAMMADSHVILEFAGDWLSRRGFTGPVAVMGRSLGSAAALELAASHPDRVDGLIIESGFALAGPLLNLLGVDAAALGFVEAEGFRNVDKIRQWGKPLLVIHAEYDQIIPFSDGLMLYEACPSREKTLLRVAGAGHNDVLAVGLAAYLEAVTRLGRLISRPASA